MAYERNARPEWKPGSRAPVAREAPVTVLCGCGVEMAVAWRTRAPLRCFGCDRVFEPPPHVAATPFVWRPERALIPLPPEPEPRGVLAGALIALVLGTLAALGVLVVMVSPA